MHKREVSKIQKWEKGHIRRMSLIFLLLPYYLNFGASETVNFHAYIICIPLFHHCSPAHHLNHFPCQHHQLTPGPQKPKARTRLIGTGSMSQIPPFARSSTSKWAIRRTQLTRKHALPVLRSQRGNSNGSIKGTTNPVRNF